MQNLDLLENKIGTLKIAVPLTAASFDEIKKEAMLLRDLSPDFIEWRADFFDEVSNPSKLKELIFEIDKIIDDIPLIFTLRTSSQGGGLDLPIDSYSKILKDAMETSIPSFVDIESSLDSLVINDLLKYAKGRNIETIISYHNFDGDMSEAQILNKFDELKKYAADLIKFAIYANSPSDNDALMKAAYDFKSENMDKKIVAIAMGEHGIKSRTEHQSFGGYFTFASGVNASAPGQIPIWEMR